MLVFIKKYTVLLIALIGFHATAQEQTHKLTTKNIKVNFLSLFIQTVSLSYEHQINPNHSLQLNTLAIINFDLTAYLPIKDNYLTKLSDEKNTYLGYAFTPAYRLYFGRDYELTGLYVSPFLRYLNYEIIGPSIYDYKIISTGYGLLTGYQSIIGHQVVVDVYLGLGVNEYKIDYNQFEETVNKNQIRFGFNLGWAF